MILCRVKQFDLSGGVFFSSSSGQSEKIGKQNNLNVLGSKNIKIHIHVQDRQNNLNVLGSKNIKIHIHVQDRQNNLNILGSKNIKIHIHVQDSQNGTRLPICMRAIDIIFEIMIT
jgi:hypothetical protein